jgi:hypothetical protein
MIILNNRRLKSPKFVFFFLMFCLPFTACEPEPPTLEKQVEILLTSSNTEKLKQLAYAVADSLNPKSVELITAVNGSSYNHTTVLNHMFDRYVKIVDKNDQNTELALTCISLIQSETSAEYLGKKTIKSEHDDLCFQLISSFPTELRRNALYAGLKVSNNEPMEDKLIAELYNLIGDNLYSELANNPSLVTISVLKKINATILSDKYIDKDLKKKHILAGLKHPNADKEFKSQMVYQSKKYGNDIMISLIDEWYNKRDNKQVSLISLYGRTAVRYLTAQLGEDDKAIELLARIGKPAVKDLLYKMKHKDQEVRFAAADALVKMVKHHPDEVEMLTNVFDTKKLSDIAKNYPFYIRMGQRGTETLLLNALNRYFSQNMCVDYLNCGNNEVEKGAKEIAERKGYNVFFTPGSHYGPKWGSGN